MTDTKNNDGKEKSNEPLSQSILESNEESQSGNETDSQNSKEKDYPS